MTVREGNAGNRSVAQDLRCDLFLSEYASQSAPERFTQPEKVSVNALATELRPRHIAYLSCSAGTLARDLGLLTEAGYRVTRLLPLDFFPQTRHVEVLATLAR